MYLTILLLDNSMTWRFYYVTILWLDVFYYLTILLLDDSTTWRFYDLTVLVLDDSSTWRFFYLTILLLFFALQCRSYIGSFSSKLPLIMWKTTFWHLDPTTYWSGNHWLRASLLVSNPKNASYWFLDGTASTSPLIFQYLQCFCPEIPSINFLHLKLL